jgi:hypothetical protein
MIDDLSRIEDEDSTQLILVDSENQALWIRVGPVYLDNGVADEPVVWVEYQPDYKNSYLRGPVLITAKDWDRLDKIVRERISEFDKSHYGKGTK